MFVIGIVLLAMVAGLLMARLLRTERAENERAAPAARTTIAPARYDPGPPSAQAIADRVNMYGPCDLPELRLQADESAATFSRIGGAGFGPDAQAVAFLDGLLQNRKVHVADEVYNLASNFGPLLGQAICTAGMGRWLWLAPDQAWRIDLGQGRYADPFGAVSEYLRKGSAGAASVLEFYHATVRTLQDNVHQRVREQIAAAEEAAYGTASDLQVSIRIFEAITLGAGAAGLRAVCGMPLTLASLCSMVSVHRLKTVAQLLDDTPSLAHASEVLDLLKTSGLITIRMEEVGVKMLPRVQLVGAPDALITRQMRNEIGSASLVQYRLYGEPQVRMGRVFGARHVFVRRLYLQPRETDNMLQVRCDESGDMLCIPYHAVMYDSGKPAHDLIDARMAAHTDPFVPYAVIPVVGFDPLGEPELRFMIDGSLEIAFEFMPPSWACDDPESFDSFDRLLCEKLQRPVEWIDREIFRIASPMSWHPYLILEFLQGRVPVPPHLAANSARADAGGDLREVLRAAVAEAGRMAAEEEFGDEKGAVHLMRALTPDQSAAQLRACFGGPLQFAALTAIVPAPWLMAVAQQGQSWFDFSATEEGAQERLNRIGFLSDFIAPHARALLDALIDDQLLRLKPAMIDGVLRFVVHLVDAPQLHGPLLAASGEPQ